MNWQDIDRDNLKDINDAKRDAAAYEVMGWMGDTWPRLVLAILEDTKTSGFEIQCHIKGGSTGWWEKVPIPNELRTSAAYLVLGYQPKR